MSVRDRKRNMDLLVNTRDQRTVVTVDFNRLHDFTCSEVGDDCPFAPKGDGEDYKGHTVPLCRISGSVRGRIADKMPYLTKKMCSFTTTTAHRLTPQPSPQENLSYWVSSPIQRATSFCSKQLEKATQRAQILVE